jgi:acyl-CoA reductase-like NAD-dependent aldehyde dehydrogenase
MYLGGRWQVPSGAETFDVICPSTEEAIARVPLGSTADMDTAAAAARTAFDEGPWPRMSPKERAAVLQRVADALRPRIEELAHTITAEMGAPIAATRIGQASMPISLIDYYCEMVQDFTFSERRLSAAGTDCTIIHEPVGVVAAIIPFNGPLWLAVYKLAPALLAGCTVIVKPSPETPLSAYILAEAIESAGFPEGVISIVTADRDESRYLVEHPAVDKVVFTGSTVGGRQVMASCAQGVKRVTLELGGKSPAIFLDDVDLGTAVKQYLPGPTNNNGQACSALTRVLVPHHLHDELVDLLAQAFTALRIGDPFDDATAIGPLSSQRIRDRVEGYIALGLEEGAKIVAGGGRPSGLDRGWYLEPTLFVNAPNSARIAQEEIFGPVVTVIPYGSVDEAVHLANDTIFGLYASVFTSDPERGNAIARRVRAGMVSINRYASDIRVPSGGFKQSGIGRKGGPEGLMDYLETKTVIHSS